MGIALKHAVIASGLRLNLGRQVGESSPECESCF